METGKPKDYLVVIVTLILFIFLTGVYGNMVFENHKEEVGKLRTEIINLKHELDIKIEERDYFIKRSDSLMILHENCLEIRDVLNDVVAARHNRDSASFVNK